MEYIKLKQKVRNYNWDDGFSIPQEILDSPQCDLELALEIFYLADGYAYLDNPMVGSDLKEWSTFISDLYNNILDGKYVSTQSGFEIPLNNVQKYNLRKKQVPEVFLSDLYERK